LKLFVVDDSERLRQQIIAMLCELQGLEIIGQAQNVSEAFQAICELKPDILTLDIQMLGGSGIELLKRLRLENRYPVVIMLTNYASAPYRKKCLAVGADFFLDKSTEFGKVREIIQRLLERYELVKDQGALQQFNGEAFRIPADGKGLGTDE
jgi:DNA-binding NarL/FixJ family response regulator